MQLGSLISCHHRFKGSVPFPPSNRTFRPFQTRKNRAHTVTAFFCFETAAKNFHLQNSGTPYRNTDQH